MLIRWFLAETKMVFKAMDVNENVCKVVIPQINEKPGTTKSAINVAS